MAGFIPNLGLLSVWQLKGEFIKIQRQVTWWVAEQMCSSLSRAKAFKAVSPRIKVTLCSSSVRHDSGITSSKSTMTPPNPSSGLDAYGDDKKKIGKPYWFHTWLDTSYLSDVTYTWLLIHKINSCKYTFLKILKVYLLIVDNLTQREIIPRNFNAQKFEYKSLLG